MHADLHTFVPERNHPLADVKRFAAQTARPGSDHDDDVGVPLVLRQGR